MLINYIIIAISGFLMGIVFLFRKFVLRYNILMPHDIPLIGGVIMYLSFICACLLGFLLYRSVSQEAISIIITSFIMLIFGVIDDWKELSVFAKFLAQLIITSFLIFFGIKMQIVYFSNITNIVITFIWVLGISNAFNHLDILDGLAAGTAVIVSLGFFAVSLLNGDSKNIILSLALSGAICSFLIYNLPPAKIYMGNSGSHFLGFILAAIALLISYAPLERKVALVSPLLILGLPIFDTAFLILMRIKNRRFIFKKSNDHLALRFLKLGYSKNKTLGFILLLALLFSSSGVMASQVTNLWSIIIISYLVLLSLFLTKKMRKVIING